MKKFFEWIMKAYSAVANAGTYLQAPLLLLVRVYWGYAFLITGWGKFMNLTKTAAFFESLNIPLPAFSAYLVATVETFGGLLLIIGLASRLAALPLVIAMVTAYFTAHYSALQNILENPAAFMAESPFMFLYASLLVLAFGPGLLSFDGLAHYFGKGKSSST